MTTINKKVSELDAASDLTGAELFYGDDGTKDVKVTSDQLRAYAVADSDVVHKSGDESITGVKTFADGSLRTVNGSFTLALKGNGSPTADRGLSWNLNDADRAVSLAGDVTYAGAFTTAGAYAVTLTFTGATGVTFPTTGTLATLAGAESLTNKTLDNTNIVTFRDDRFTLQDNGDATKQLKHELSGITTATTRTATWPDANITVVGAAATQSITNKTFDNSNTYTTRSDRVTWQDSSDTTKQLTFVLSGIGTGTTRTATWPNASITVVGTAATQNITNKTFDNSNTYTTRTDRMTLQDSSDATKQVTWNLSGVTTGNTRVLTVPNATDDLVGRTIAQTLTNKTLTAPTLNDVITLGGTATGTFTPTVTLTGGAGNTVPVYTTNSGRYTRIGNRCWVDILLSGDGGAEGAGTGIINVALPFAANASALGVGGMVGVAQNGTAEYMLAADINAGGSVAVLRYFDTIANRASLTGDLQNNTTRFINLSFCYEI